jgi:type IV pilus assembly protein PilW
MQSRHRSIDVRQESQRGFSMLEVMIGLLIGLVATLAIATTLGVAESQKRTASAGSDAQLNGELALDAIQRAVSVASYGFALAPTALGCPMVAKYAGTAIPGFAVNLAPVTLSVGNSGYPDTIRALASGKAGVALPAQVTVPGYTAGNTSFPVGSTLGFSGPATDSAGNVVTPGDLVLATNASAQNCEVFQVNAALASPTALPRADDGAWNATGFPAGSFPSGSQLVNLGQLVDVAFTVQNSLLQQNILQFTGASGAPAYSGWTELLPGIVNLKAIYGRDTDADGVVDTWDTSTPANNAQWRQVIALRVALVAQSAQYQKEEVTSANPTWNVGASLPGWWTGCTSGRCPLRVDHLADWKHYRYQVYDTTIPLRNSVWNEN